jgi:NIMA (never in mitosis gene a)-related kinase
MRDETTTPAGTIPYMAPEVFDEHKEATITADTWSFGCLLYEMCTHKGPYGNDNMIAVKNLVNPNGKPPGDVDNFK